VIGSEKRNLKAEKVLGPRPRARIVSDRATGVQIPISPPSPSPTPPQSPMAGFVSDDDFAFDYFSDGADFSYDPFDCDDGDEREEFCVSAFAFPDGDDGEEFCVSGFSFPDDDDGLVVQDRASQASHEEPILETLGRSFDSDEDLTVFLPQLVSAMELTEDICEEDTAGDGGDAAEFILSGLDREPGLVIQEDADHDGDDGLELMLSGFDLDPRPVTGGFQTLVGADEGWEDAAGDDDMGDLLPAFRMLVEDIDSDDSDLVDALARHVEEIGAQSRRLSVSRAFIEALPDVPPSEEEALSDCAVCKDGIAAGQLVVRLPCKHFFHGDCIRPWLAIRNTCPVCRCELPTGDAEYDRRLRTAGGVSPAQHSATAQV
jgi:E3 ubiquitin-protein ligase RNF115/126